MGHPPMTEEITYPLQIRKLWNREIFELLDKQEKGMSLSQQTAKKKEPTKALLQIYLPQKQHLSIWN